MEITREWWAKSIRPRFNDVPNLMLENDLIEFGSKALDRIDRQTRTIHLLHFKLKLIGDMYPENMRMATNVMKTVDELAEMKNED